MRLAALLLLLLGPLQDPSSNRLNLAVWSVHLLEFRLHRIVFGKELHVFGGVLEANDQTRRLLWADLARLLEVLGDLHERAQVLLQVGEMIVLRNGVQHDALPKVPIFHVRLPALAGGRLGAFWEQSRIQRVRPVGLRDQIGEEIPGVDPGQFRQRQTFLPLLGPKDRVPHAGVGAGLHPNLLIENHLIRYARILQPRLESFRVLVGTALHP